MMVMQKNMTADYKVVPDGAGYRFIFYCQVSGAHACTTEHIYPGEPEEALILAWQTEGHKHFNRCGRCGKWVIDAVFNAEVLACVECAPYEADPEYCMHCGVKVEPQTTHCRNCGGKLIYGGGGGYHDTEASV